MKHLVTLAAAAAATLAVASPASAQRAPVYSSGQEEEARFDVAQQRFEREYDAFQQALERYRSYRSRPIGPPPPPPPRGGYSSYDPADDQFYDPVRDYRAPPPNYQERVLTQDDRVYRGQDGKYYCRRSDGTTGLIVGAAAGGLFGNIIAGGRSKTVGTLLGAVAGGALGSAADRDSVRCR
ncbi:glycine zipper 2TM domain-containing protein [Sphingomonas sp. KR3-1]|uniref:glycine zipper 2TM domain-containing protein n=1 Tax=Sphingomonas sp. KR3-1 TaxID=3156611 RepID=UPI0032B5676A